VLEPQLFTIYINDLEEGTECTVAKCADDTKVRGKADCKEGINNLQRYVDRLRK